MGKYIAISVVLLWLLNPAQALAQCENALDATSQMLQTLATDSENITKYSTQETSFINKKFETAEKEFKGRLDEFDKNVSRAWVAWMDRFIPALKDMTRELSISQIEQTRQIGMMIDAQLRNEALRFKREQLSAASRRHAPAPLTCQVDSVAPGQSKAYQMARPLARAFAVQNTPRIANAKGSPAATGTVAEMRTLWEEYVTKFCDNTKGDQGCTEPGVLAGRNRDLPGLLWGTRQTIDAAVPDNRLLMEATMRYLVRPLSEDPILLGAADSSPGRKAILKRRAEAARINTVYNVLGQMIGERVGGSGVNTQSLRVAAGLPPQDAATDASYREIQQTMTQDRFNNPKYLTGLVGNPEQVSREQVMLNAARLQVLNDLYRRSEEMLFMEAAGYSRDLDRQMPPSAISSMPLERQNAD